MNQPTIEQAARLKDAVTRRDLALQALKTAENPERVQQAAGHWLDQIDETAAIAAEVTGNAQTFACTRGAR